MSAGASRPFPVAVEAGEPGPGPSPREIPGTGEIVLVASGKGGVGKSTVAVNLACAAAARGLRIGVLDADLYGPSVARMLGTGEGLARDGRGRTLPAVSHGVHSVSVANLLPPEAGLVWKGPLVAQGLLQMFHEVAWPGLDLLLVDLPPGTGDVQLTVLEQIPVAGALIVTTPQALAVADAERAVAMFHQRDIPVFGVIENMDRYLCPCCGEAQDLFPGGGARRLAARKHVPFLGGVPLDPGAQTRADAGTPLVLADPDGPVAGAFASLAGALTAALARERRSRERARDEVARAGHQAFWERLLDED